MSESCNDPLVSDGWSCPKCDSDWVAQVHSRTVSNMSIASGLRLDLLAICNNYVLCLQGHSTADKTVCMCAEIEVAISVSTPELWVL